MSFMPTTPLGFVAVQIALAGGVELVSWAAETQPVISGTDRMAIFEVVTAPGRKPLLWRATVERMETEREIIISDLVDIRELEDAVDHLPAHKRVVRDGRAALDRGDIEAVRKMASWVRANAR